MAGNKQIGNYNSNFATTLRDLIDRDGVKHEELANAIDKKRQSIYQYTCGMSEPKYDTLTKIADFFDVSVDYLLKRTSDPSLKPSSVDELSLSPEAIKNILQIGSTNSSALKILIAILENPMLFKTLISINNLSNTIGSEIERQKEFTNLNHDINKIALMDDQNDIAFIKELEKTHPEFTNRIFVASGRNSIERRIDDILDLFRFIITDVSNYDELY